MSFEWQNLTNGSFKGIPFHVAIPNRNHQYGVESEEMSIERRLQFIKRPLVDGAGVRDWGSDPENFVAVVEFFGVNHAKTAETFLQALNQGTPGILVLPTAPKAVLAYFWKRTRSTTYREGNAIKVTVTWVAATEVQTDNTGKATGADLTPPSIDEAKSALDTDVSNALSILQDNPLLSAVRTFQGGLSKVRSVVNAVLTLEEGVRNKISNLDANIKGTLALIKSATDEIQSLFSPTASNVAPSGSSLGTNSQTGQTVTDFSEPDTIPAPVDPLAPPAVQPTISISTNNLGTTSGVGIFGSSVSGSLSGNRDDLTSNSGGRTEDV
ncbi:MAG: DNA circularization N-terminal domain-containing protein, partial [Isosphaeraceae bacterium]